MHYLKIDFLCYVLGSFTTIMEETGGGGGGGVGWGGGRHCHDILIGGGMPHSDHMWGWVLGGCDLQWSVLGDSMHSLNNRFPRLHSVVCVWLCR